MNSFQLKEKAFDEEKSISLISITYLYFYTV